MVPKYYAKCGTDIRPAFVFPGPKNPLLCRSSKRSMASMKYEQYAKSHLGNALLLLLASKN